MRRWLMTAVACAAVAFGMPARAFEFEMQSLTPDADQHAFCRAMLELESQILVVHSEYIVDHVAANEALQPKLFGLLDKSPLEMFDGLLALADEADVPLARLMPFKVTLYGWREHYKQCPNEKPDIPV